MRAIVQERYGSPADLHLREVDMPVPGEGEVLVRVHAASLHPDVWHVVCGRPYVLRLMGGGFRRPTNPVPGTDMAGVVESVGRGATRFRPGDPVFGETLAKFQWAHGGAYAEYVAVKEHLLARKPENVTFEQAASVPSSGFIALGNLRDVRRWAPGKRVLIIGAGGGVGSLALQISRAHGARVTAVDTTGKLDMLRSLGADEVIDYTKDDVLRRGVRYDLVIDVPGHRPFSDFRPVLEPDGRYVPIGHEGYGALGRHTFGLVPHFLALALLSRLVRQLRGPGLPMPTKEDAIAALREYLASGVITPIIDSGFPLERIREAFRHMMEDETRGKVIITPTGAA